MADIAAEMFTKFINEIGVEGHKMILLFLPQCAPAEL